MALEKTVTTPQGFDAVDAYHRVNSVALISKNKINFSVQSFKSKDAAVAFVSEQHSCLYDLTGNNPIAQAYYHLKTLPEFAGAKDC
jgi:hypothetical protein